MKEKCEFLLLSLADTGSMKCIIYCNGKDEIKDFRKALEVVNEFHCFKYDVDQITIDTNKDEKKRILNILQVRIAITQCSYST